jgi:GTPase
MRFGTVSLVGRSNVGKSTFLNAALGERLAIVSPLPQTTRDAMLGIAHRPSAQIAFIDTPGLHRPRSELGRRMNAAALDAARSTDVVMMMTDVVAVGTKGAPEVLAEDRDVLALLPSERPSVLVVNKLDLLRDKARLLPWIDAYVQAHPFREVIPISARRGADVERVLEALAALLPEGPAGYEQDTLTNRPVSFFIREYVREAVMLGSQREVPHAVAVAIDAIEESPKALVVKATLHVEKPGQRKILIGKAGERIRAIGIAARLRIEELVGRKVYLELFVRVTPRWKNVPRQLVELGYDATDLPEIDPEPTGQGKAP